MGETSAQPPIRVLLVDDQPIFAEALRLFLDRDARIEIVGIAGDGGEAVELADRRDAQVVVMDLGLPGADGIETTRRLRVRRPETAVIVLTGRSSDEAEADARSAGAVGFVTKGGIAETEELLEQIVALDPLNADPA